MLVKKSGERFIIALEEDEATSIVVDLAKRGMRASLHRPSRDLIETVNRLHWQEHGFNIHDAVAPYSDLVEWSDEDAEAQGE